MIIRKLKPFDKINIEGLTFRLDDDTLFDYISRLNYNPLSTINYFVPIKYKFISDTFVAVENNEIIGLISIGPRKNNHYKWKIKKLYLNEANLFEAGKALVDNVISKYAEKGVETFEINVDNDNQKLIDLFSKQCGFRYCSDYKFYNIKTSYYKNKQIQVNTHIFRPYKHSDNKDVAELYNQNISPYYKFSLSKTPEEFNDTLCKGFENKFYMKYIFEDKFSKKINGYIEVYTRNNINYIMEAVILQSYENYFEDILTFCVSQISRRTKNFDLCFKNCKYHLNAESFEKDLSEIDNEVYKTDMIFVKDFLRQIKDSESIKNRSVLYSDINGKPAYKI